MNAATGDESEKPEVRIRSKKYWMITGIFVGLTIIGILAFLHFPISGNNGNALGPIATNFPAHFQISPLTPQKGTSAIPQSDSYTRETSKIPVDFVLQSGVVTSCGLTCRQLDAAIINTGFETAHNVCITVALHTSKNEVISLNGDPFIERCIGDLAGGEAKTEPVSIDADCGTFATKCVGETLTLQILVSSDEKTAQFPDQVING
jgi:hypothetical protein